MTRKLEGKVALVSGSGRGIGREIALKLASEGARVVINDLDQAPAEETVADIVARGGQAVACVRRKSRSAASVSSGASVIWWWPQGTLTTCTCLPAARAVRISPCAALG